MLVRDVMNRFEVDSKLYSFEKEFQARLQKIIDKMESRFNLAVEGKAAKEDVTQIQASMASVKDICKTECKLTKLEQTLSKFIEGNAINKESWRVAMNDQRD